MKTHPYKLTFKGISRRSFGIWLFLFLYIAITVFISIFDVNFYTKLVTLIIFNFICLFIFFPGLLLHLVYITNGIHKTILIDPEEIIVMKKGKEIRKIRMDEIEKIVQVQAFSWTRFPWMDHYYYKIIDREGVSLKMNCYFLKDGEIWKNPFLRTNQDKLLSVKEVFLPL